MPRQKLEDYAKAPEEGSPSDATTPKPHPCINPKLQCAAPPSETTAFGEAVGGLPFHGMDALCKATGIDSGQCGSCMQSPSKKCKGADVAFAALGQMAMLASPELMMLMMLPMLAVKPTRFTRCSPRATTSRTAPRTCPRWRLRLLSSAST